MDELREVIQTIGAIAAILLLIVRLPADLHLVRVRSTFSTHMRLRGEEDLSPGATFTASIHNLGRELQLASVVTGFDDYGESAEGMSKTLKRGEHFQVSYSVLKLEYEADQFANAFDGAATTNDDLFKLSTIFKCGELCQHEAKLDRAGRKAVKEFIAERERCAALAARDRAEKAAKSPPPEQGGASQASADK